MQTSDWSVPDAKKAARRHMPRMQDALSEVPDYHWNYSRVRTAFKFVHDTAVAAFDTTGKIGGRTLRKTHDRTDALVVGELRPLTSHYRSRSMAGLDGGDGITAFESCHVIVVPVEASTSYRETVFQLHSLRVLLAPDVVETDYIPLPLTFRLHAAARLLERSESADASLRQVGMDLVGWAAMLRLAEHTLLEGFDGAMRMPAFGGGLICGAFRPDYALPEGFATKVTAEGQESRSLPRHPSEPEGFEVSTYFAHSFGGPYSEALRRGLLQWRERHRPQYDKEQASLLWPGRKLSTPKPAGFGSALADDLEAILADRSVSGYIVGEQVRTDIAAASRRDCPPGMAA